MRERTHSLACKKLKAHERNHHRFAGYIPAFPAQWFSGLYRALPGHRAFLPPSPANCSASLTPASGRQDHTTLPSAIAPLVLRHSRVHRIPLPTSVTIAKRPSDGSGTRQCEVYRWCVARARTCDRLTRRAVCAWRICAICLSGKSIGCGDTGEPVFDRSWPKAFSSEVVSGSRKENASKQKTGASVPIQSERKRL